MRTSSPAGPSRGPPGYAGINQRGWVISLITRARMAQEKGEM
jgi:hypothetical protein